MRYISIFVIFLMFFNCKEKQSETVDANAIINKSISVSGVKKLDKSTISFDFRELHYVAVRNVGKFELQREFKDSTGFIHDYLRNKGFERYVNDSLVELPDSLITNYGASVNSVHYFSVLPYGLDSEAVRKTYLGTIDIKGKPYQKIKVTFDENGGGEDFEDEFIYWMNKENSKIDYMAYSYEEADGRGLRFREAYNERYVKGIRFVDYNNFKPKDRNITLEGLDRLFIENKLELLSKIELKNVIVN